MVLGEARDGLGGAAFEVWVPGYWLVGRCMGRSLCGSTVAAYVPTGVRICRAAVVVTVSNHFIICVVGVYFVVGLSISKSIMVICRGGRERPGTGW